MTLLPRRSLAELAPPDRDVVSPEAEQVAAGIVADVRSRGLDAVVEHALELGDIDAAADLVVPAEALQAALEALPPGDRERLERVASRIRRFAVAQRGTLQQLTAAIPGGQAGHVLAPVEVAGCYAPGGRHPLPSSVLMTALTARVAGVTTVWVASPRPAPLTLAAAAVAGADGLLAAGGAQAIAALAHGAGPVPAADVVVGPGNAYVTAAKKLVAGRVRIDMLAGPSELVVLADGGADAGLVAADLLAQAEHDPEARPILVTTSEDLATAVEAELAAQLTDLPTAEAARAALAYGGGALVVGDFDEAVAACDRLAPEHLQLLVAEPEPLRERLRHHGALFLGAGAGEVLGDYGAGPNHVLPTGGTARGTGGLGVATFLRTRTWLRIDDAAAARELAEDAAWLARVEGLEAHARAAERRLPG